MSDDASERWPRIIDLSNPSAFGKWPVRSPEAVEVANEYGVPLYVISGNDFLQLVIRAIDTGDDLLSTIVNVRNELMAAATDTTGMDRQ